MSENVIYTPSVPQNPQIPVQQNTPPQSGVPPQQASAPPSEEEPQSRRGLVIRVLIGFAVVVVLLIVVIVVILPIFRKNGGGSGQVTLTYWGLWEDQKVMQPILDEFHKNHPNIKVSYVMQDPKQYRERLLTRIQEGAGPDIYRFHNTWVPMLTNRQALLPLPDDVIPAAEFKKVYYPVMTKDLIKNGALYGIPLQIDTLALFINPEIFDAQGASVPVTWDEFRKVAVQLTVPDELGSIRTAGAALGAYDNVTHAPDILSLLFLQSKVNMVNINSSLEETALALEFYTRFDKGSEKVWDANLDRSLLAFANGNLAMYFGYSWDIFAIQAINKDLTFSVHPVPRLAAGDHVTVASYWVEGVSAKSKHQKEAFLFMQYLTKKETLQKLYTEQAKVRTFGELYPQIGLADSLKEDDLIYPFVSQAQFAESSFFVSDTQDGASGMNTILTHELGDAVRAITNDNTSAATAVEDLALTTAKEFTKYGLK